jgi:hypothetical protein
MFTEDWAKAGKRSSLPIMAYVGGNGHGKDLAMVHDTIPTLLAGQPALSTVRLRDWLAPCRVCGSNPCEVECGKRDWPDHPLWIPFRGFSDLLEFREGDVLMSEVQGVASAREHQGLPYEVANFLRKFRHYDVRLRWNAPDFAAPDAVIRRVTQAVTICKGSWGTPHALPCTECGECHVGPRRACKSKGRQRLWPDNRFFTWRTYDRSEFESWETAQANTQVRGGKRLKPLVVQHYRRTAGFVQEVYDTYGEVLSLGSADAAGVCITCGGARQRRKCVCADHVGAPGGVRLVDVAHQAPELLTAPRQRSPRSSRVRA